MIPGLLMIRLEGRVFFANAERIAEKLRPLVEAAQPRVVALDLGAVFDLEYSAPRMLIEAEKRMHQEGTTVWLVGLNPDVLAMVQRSPLGAGLGRAAGRAPARPASGPAGRSRLQPAGRARCLRFADGSGGPSSSRT